MTQALLVYIDDNTARLLIQGSLVAHVDRITFVDTAAGLQTALDEHRYNLLITDSHATWSALSEVAAPPPVLMITPNEMPAIDAALRAGAHEVLSLPLHPTILRQRVQVLMSATHQPAERLYRLIFEASSDIMILANLEDTRIIEANHSACNALGYSLDELIGQPMSLIEFSDKRASDTLPVISKSGNRIVIEQFYRRKDGTSFLIENNARIIRYGGKAVILAMSRDISRRQQMLEQTQMQRDRAEALVATRTAELEQVNLNLRQEIAARAADQEQLEHVLLGARCILWTATLRLEGDLMMMQDLRVTNPSIARSILALNAPDEGYSAAFVDSISREDLQRLRYVYTTHTRFGKLSFGHELRCTSAEGNIHWLAVNVRLEAHPTEAQAWRVIALGTDITSLKEAQEELNNARLELQERNDELEVRVAERTIELTRALRTLEQEILERAKAQDAERTQRVLAEALHETSESLNRDLERDAILDQILVNMGMLIPHDGINVMLIEDNGKTGRIVRALGYDDLVTQFQHPIERYSNMMLALKSRRYQIIADTLQAAWTDLQGTEWIRSNITVPIAVDDEVIGFLSLDSRVPNTFTNEHGHWLQAFATQAAIAIRNARFVETIRQQNAELDQRVTERTRELSREKALLGAILEAMRDGLVYQDMRGQVQYANRSLSEVTGYSADEWAQLEPQVWVMESAEAERKQKHIAHSLEQQGYWEGELVLRRQDGTEMDVRLNRSVVRDPEGTLIGFISLLRDISQEKRLDAQKRRFIATAAHELRTPITNLKMRFYLMRRRTDEWAEHLEVAEQVTHHMQNLVGDMFDINRFERGVIELHYERIVMQEFIHQVLRYHAPEAEQREIELHLELPAQALELALDPNRFAQVLTNLVHNALQHTPAAGRILIGLSEQAGYARLSVTDTGSGIAPENLPHLFEPFYRAKNDGTGAGLGLTISREIVVLHGGDIEVQSELGRGTTFTIRLPMHPLEEAQ